MRFHRPLALSIILAFLATTVLAAQAAGGPRYALVIGNGSYSELSKLKNPANDARDMAEALKGLGFEVKLLVDADLPSMDDAVVRLGNSLAQSADSVGFFFYAGHGVQSQGINYLIPADARIPSESYLKMRALAAQTVLDTLQDSRNALNVVVLDACRDNPFSWGRSASRGLQVVSNQPTGSIVAYATSAGSVAQDGEGRNGVFTAQLLKQIKAPGVEIKDVFNRTGAAVQAATAGKQVPAVYNQFFGNAYLAGATAAAARPAAPANPSPVAVAPQAAAPTMSITRAYGSLRVTAATAGSLYLDGAKLGDLPAGAKADLANIEVGERRLELRYAEGSPETLAVTVLEGQTANVSFSWKMPAAPVQVPAAAAPAGFVLAPAGSFLMGSPAGEAGRGSDEGPQHEVRLSAFMIGRYEVTQAEWTVVMGTNPSKFKGDRLPVEQVSWYDILVYCNKRSMKEGLGPCYSISGSTDPARWGSVPTSGNASWDAVNCDFSANGYRLPTEAEWEYAAKGGPAARGLAANAVYAGSASLDQVAWYSGNSGNQTHPVGEKAANALGLYDMAGNVWEWCWDWYGSYATGAQADPSGAAGGAGQSRVSRGGSWYSGPAGPRSAIRSGDSPEYRSINLGFRLLRRP